MIRSGGQVLLKTYACLFTYIFGLKQLIITIVPSGRNCKYRIIFTFKHRKLCQNGKHEPTFFLQISMGYFRNHLQVRQDKMQLYISCNFKASPAWN